jgi:cell division transport system permease protein
VFSGLVYHIKEGINGFVKNRLVNTAAVGMLIACLLVTGAFSLLVFNINKIINDIGAENEISVFLDESCTDEQAIQIGQLITGIPSVTGLKYVSKEEGLESLREEFGSLLDGLEDDNPIRDSYIVEISDQSQIVSVVQRLETISGIANINYNSDVAQRFLKIRNMIALVGAAFIVVLGVLSVFIIANSVRISAFTRRTEIAIMKTVGATNGFIRLSFIFEGLFIGIIGAVISYIGIWLIYIKAFEPAVSSLNFIEPIPFQSFVAPLALVYGGAGLLIGLLGSSLALRRYLRR